MKNQLFVILMLAFFGLSLNAQVTKHSNPLSDKNSQKNPQIEKSFPGIPLKCDTYINGLKTKTIAWKWDTVYTYDVSLNAQRITRKFDAQGDALTQLTKSKALFGPWTNVDSICYTYDSNGNMLSQTDATWQTNAWVNNKMSLYTYDSYGNMLTQTDAAWQGAVWINSDRYTYTYDSNHNELTKLYETGAGLITTWTSVYRHTFTYSNGNKLTDHTEDWQNSAWVNTIYETFVYDIHGYLDTSLLQEWQTGAWVNETKVIYTNNTSGKELTDLWLSWSSTVWDTLDRNTNTYDINGNMATALNENWVSNAWVATNRFTYTTDINKDILSILNEVYANGVWSNHWRRTYSYDANGNSTTGRFEQWSNGNWIQSIDYLFLFSLGVKTDMIMDINNYTASYASFAGSGIAEIIENNNINIYPNPAINNLTIESPQNAVIEITNVKGQLIKTLAATGNKTNIVVSAFPSGVYVVEIRTEKGMAVKKFIKE